MVEGGGEFAVTRLVREVRGRAGQPAPFRLQGRELLVHGALLGGVAPRLDPVDVRVGTGGGADDLEHPLGRVRLGGAGVRAVALKVSRQDPGRLADLAKVDGPAALGEEQEAVEALEEHGRRLVDRAQDGLAVVLQFLEQVQDGPRGLRVQAGGGFVQEEQELGLRGELDADGEALPLLDVEALPGDADDGVGVLGHLEQLDDLVDVRQLLLAGHVRGLAEQGAEVERLADGRRLEVEVLLLDVARLALEGLVALEAVDQHLTRDDAHGHARREDVEERGLAGAGDAHEGREGAGLDPTVDVVEQSSLPALDLDVVTHVLPLEDGRLFLDDAGDGLELAVIFPRRDSRTRMAAFGVRRGQLLEYGRLVSTSEHEHFTFRLLGGDELGGHQVENHEANQKGP